MELAEARARLEERLAELEREVELLKLVLNLIDETLTQKKAPEARREGARAPISQQAPAPPPKAAGKAAARTAREELGSKLSAEVLKSKDGRELAKFTVHERGLVVEPLIEVPAGSPPFLNFLVMKVLNGYRREDSRAARYGDIKPDEALDFAVFEEGGLVKKIVVWNWREKERLEDIRGAVKWALTRVLERSEAP